MKPVLLLYHLGSEREEQIRKAVMPFGISVRQISESELSKSVLHLAQDADAAGNGKAEDGEDAALVMCGLSKLQFDLLMGLFARKKLPLVPVKAVMTETNQAWPFEKLVQEIWEEHRKMHFRKDKI